MKLLVLSALLATVALVFMGEANSGTCTQISRTNYVTNEVLTSSSLNDNFNTVYNNANAYDGGCITDGTIEDGGLSTTDFAVLFNGIAQGCEVTRTGIATLSVDECLLSLNNNFVRTVASTAVNWTHLDTGSEAASTTYYIYADSSSTGATITPVVSVTGPDGDGFKGNDKIIGKFYNDSFLNVATSSVINWVGSEFIRKDTAESVLRRQTTSVYYDEGDDAISNAGPGIASRTKNGTGDVTITFTTDYWATAPNCTAVINTSLTVGHAQIVLIRNGTTDIQVLTAGSTTAGLSRDFTLTCDGETN